MLKRGKGCYSRWENVEELRGDAMESSTSTAPSDSLWMSLEMSGPVFSFRDIFLYNSLVIHLLVKLRPRLTKSRADHDNRCRFGHLRFVLEP